MTQQTEPCLRAVLAVLVPVCLFAFLEPGRKAAAGDLRLIERRVEARQKTEAEWDLPPGCVVTGIGARAHVDNLTTMHVQYRHVQADGSLGPAQEKRLGDEPDNACEAKILLPEGWVVVGFGARGAPEWDVATFRVWGRRWDPEGRKTEVRAWSDGREPEAGLERSVLVEAPDRVLVGVGLRFHQNDIQGIYARSARVVRVPEGDRSLRLSEAADGVPVLKLWPRELGPIPIAALDPDRIQAELLALWRAGKRELTLDPGRLQGTAGAPAVKIAEALASDPFQAADAVLWEVLAGMVSREHVETAARALGRAPLIARLAFCAAGEPFLGRNDLPLPEELPDIAAEESSLRAVAGEKETVRWLLVQSRREIAALREAERSPWLEQAAGDLERLGLAATLWERIARAEILSRMYLMDGAPATREAAQTAIRNAQEAHAKAPFGELKPLGALIADRLETPEEKTELGGALAAVRTLTQEGNSAAAAEKLSSILDDEQLEPHLRGHWETIGGLSTGLRVLGTDSGSARLLWGGDGRWRIAKREGRWAVVTVDGGPCVYVDGTGSPERATVSFEYFDDAEGRIHVHYNSVDPATGGRHDYREAPVVPMQGSGEWRTAEVSLDRCVFRGGQNLGADLRLIPNRRGVAIRAIRIDKKG
jgi:hypothetical protein